MSVFLLYFITKNPAIIITMIIIPKIIPAAGLIEAERNPIFKLEEFNPEKKTLPNFFYKKKI